jgi:hypothetical protein
LSIKCNVRVALLLLSFCLTAARATADPAPFDRIAVAYAPYLDQSDPFG